MLSSGFYPLLLASMPPGTYIHVGKTLIHIKFRNQISLNILSLPLSAGIKGLHYHSPAIFFFLTYTLYRVGKSSALNYILFIY